MLMNRALKTVASFVPIAGSAFGLVKTYVKVYNATSPSQALVARVKVIIIDCTSPVIKYPLLCVGAIAYGGAACITREPNFAVGALECCTAIVTS
jgi:hypothetical protein